MKLANYPLSSWVASAFGILGQHGSHLARELFVSVHPEYGFYQVKLFKDGHWNVRAGRRWFF
jgi:hypothetical protein